MSEICYNQTGIDFPEITLVLDKARRCARKFDPPVTLGLDQSTPITQHSVEPPKPIHHTSLKFLPPTVKGHKNWTCSPSKWTGAKPLRNMIFHVWLNYFAQNGCNDYSEQLKAMYYGMPTIYKKNEFIRTFGPKIPFVSDEESFVAMCHNIADYFDKSNIQDASYFKREWDQRNYTRQRDAEQTREYYSRLWETYTLANPDIYDQAEMRREFCRVWVKGLKNSKLFYHLRKKYLSQIKDTAQIEFLVQKSEISFQSEIHII